MGKNSPENSNRAPVVPTTRDLSIDNRIERASAYLTQVSGIVRRLDEGTVQIKRGHRTNFNSSGDAITVPLGRNQTERRTEQLQILVKYLEEETEDINKELDARRRKELQVDVGPGEFLNATRDQIDRASGHIPQHQS